MQDFMIVPKDFPVSDTASVGTALNGDCPDGKIASGRRFFKSQTSPLEASLPVADIEAVKGRKRCLAIVESHKQTCFSPLS